MKSLQKTPDRVSEYVHDAGAKVKHTYVYRGYGWHEFVVEGTYEQVDAWVKAEKGSYPPAGYGGLYVWPPGRLDYKGNPHPEQPVEFAPGMFRITASHSNSCD